MAVAIAHKLKLNTTEHFTGLTGSHFQENSRPFFITRHVRDYFLIFLDLLVLKCLLGRQKQN